MRNSDRAWELLGTSEPYGAVAGTSRYYRAQLDAQRRSEFFHAGERYIAQALRDIDEHLAPGFRPGRALDFGCGVGRMVIPLAARCDEVVGMDVAEAMLAEAARNCAGYNNVKLVKADELLSRLDGKFDLINSTWVFGHMPQSKGESIVARLAQRLDDGGIGVFQFPIAWRAAPWRKALNWARNNLPGVNGLANLARRRPFSYPLMQLNLYCLSRLFAVLDEQGCRAAFVRTEPDRNCALSATVFFRRHR